MLRALRVAVIFVGASCAACTSSSSAPAPDAGPAGDASPDSGATDAAADAARADSGRCVVDDDCPGDPRLVRRCLGGLCADFGCNREDVRCDDGNPCTVDTCEPTLLCANRPNGVCCTNEADCDDGDACTTDRCESATCAHERILSCGPCLDRDHDGATASYCGGSDCNDADPSVGPTATEDCTNTADDDCDGAVDADDVDCQPATATCAGRVVLASGVRQTGSVLSAHYVPDRCGSSAFFELPLAVESDVEVHLTLDPSTPVEGSGFDTRGVELAFLLETTCGVPSTSLVPAPPICDRFPTAFSFSRERTIFVRRVPAGSVFPEVQERLVVAGDPTLRFDLEAHARPAERPECDAAPLTFDRATRFEAPAHDGLDCFGPWAGIASQRGPERIHSFTLDAPARVRIRSTPVDGSTTRVGLVPGCDPDVARATCEESAPGCRTFATLDRILPAGTHHVVVEASAAYDLDLRREVVGAACVGARALVLDGSPATGDSTGAPDHFQYTGSPYYDSVCGSATGPDVVLAFTLAVEQDVAIRATTSYRALLRLLTACGGDTEWSSSSGSIVRHLAPGTYYVVLDGADPTQFGAYSVALTTP
ncbi:MAG: putative metal-binding motif-containing protein [Sandaracinus sp.]